jgi:hypothetical protein
VCKALACDGSDRTKCIGYANGPDKVCRPASCAGGTLQPEGTCDGKGSCKVGESETCAPYVCDGDKKCLVSCAKASDCTTGYLCVSGTCTSVRSKCSDDGASSVLLDGSATLPCNGFLCDPSNGECRKTCTGSSDCAPNFTCDGARCQPSAPTSDDGGGCAVADRGGASPAGALAWVVVGLSLVGVARRRR